jgi:hypothetical protein
MARLSISDAARVTGVSRVTLHRYIKAGKLSRTSDGMIDTAELLRVGLTLQTDTVTVPVTVQRLVTPNDTHPVTPDTTSLECLIDVLQQQLAATQAREQVAQERETLLLQMQQQNQRLLDVPRPTAPTPPAPAPGGRPEPTRTGSGAGSRGEMRRRIVALLHAHPKGLSPSEVRHRLGADKPLGNTLLAMTRDGLVQRVEYGRYVVS